MYGDIRTFRGSNARMEDEVIKDKTGESGFYRLKSLKVQKDEFIENLIGECGDDCQFSLDKTRQFLNGPGQGANFDFLSDRVKDMINGSN